jgi:hypothetical protein
VTGSAPVCQEKRRRRRRRRQLLVAPAPPPGDKTRVSGWHSLIPAPPNPPKSNPNKKKTDSTTAPHIARTQTCARASVVGRGTGVGEAFAAVASGAVKVGAAACGDAVSNAVSGLCAGSDPMATIFGVTQACASALADVYARAVTNATALPIEDPTGVREQMTMQGGGGGGGGGGEEDEAEAGSGARYPSAALWWPALKGPGGALLGGGGGRLEAKLEDAQPQQQEDPADEEEVALLQHKAPPPPPAGGGGASGSTGGGGSSSSSSSSVSVTVSNGSGGSTTGRSSSSMTVAGSTTTTGGSSSSSGSSGGSGSGSGSSSPSAAAARRGYLTACASGCANAQASAEAFAQAAACGVAKGTDQCAAAVAQARTRAFSSAFVRAATAAWSAACARGYGSAAGQGEQVARAAAASIAKVTAQLAATACSTCAGCKCKPLPKGFDWADPSDYASASAALADGRTVVAKAAASATVAYCASPADLKPRALNASVDGVLDALAEVLTTASGNLTADARASGGVGSAWACGGSSLEARLGAAKDAYGAAVEDAAALVFGGWCPRAAARMSRLAAVNQDLTETLVSESLRSCADGGPADDAGLGGGGHKNRTVRSVVARHRPWVDAAHDALTDAEACGCRARPLCTTCTGAADRLAKVAERLGRARVADALQGFAVPEEEEEEEDGAAAKGDGGGNKEKEEGTPPPRAPPDVAAARRAGDAATVAAARQAGLDVTALAARAAREAKET